MTSEYFHSLQPSQYFSGFSLVLHEQGLLDVKYGCLKASDSYILLVLPS